MDKEGSVPQYEGRKIFTRDFILVFLAYFAYMFAFFTLVPTLPVYLAGLGSNEGEIGTLIGIYSVSALISRLLAGGAISRYSEKSVMIFAALLFAVSFLAYVNLRPFWPFLVARLFHGVTYACLDTAVFALIVKVTPAVYRGQALSYLMLAPGLASVVAPSLGMSIVNRFGFSILFFICAGVSLCASLSSSTLKKTKFEKPDTDTPPSCNIFFEWKIVIPAMSAFCYYFVMGSLMAFLPLYAIQCGVVNPGYFFSANALMTVTGRALGGKIHDVWSKEKIILTFTFTSMITMIMLSFSKTLPMFIFIGLLWGLGVAFIFPVSMAYAFDYAGSSGGTAVGTFRSLTDLGFAVGPMVMGLIIPITGYQTMFLCLAFLCCINLCYFQFFVRKRRCMAVSK